MPPEPRQQYDNALVNLSLVVMNPVPDAEAEKAARKFLAEVRALPGGVASLKEAQKTITAIERAIENKDQEITDADLVHLGPASAGGYKGEVDNGGNTIRFTADVAGGGGGLPELAFARVNLVGAGGGGGGGGMMYISTTEVSVGQFAAIVERKGGAGDMAKLGLPGFDAGMDPRVGPRAWEWAGGAGAGKRGVVPARAWLSKMGVGAVQEYPPGMAPPPPSEATPMQYVSPCEAMLAARLVGCRLPSSAEWGAAKGQYAGAMDLSKFNLRDETWKKEYEWVRGLIRDGKRAQFPDAGRFIARGPGEARPEVLQHGNANLWDDGAIWFRGVGEGGGDVVHHLVGNVAEYVVDAPVTDVPAPIATAVRGYFENGAVKLGVIGGSALSDPAMPVDKVQPVGLGDAGDGYSDVGFRLAFSVGTASVADNGKRPLAARLNAILDPLPTLTGK
jgi:hypothetical protein